MRHLAGHRRRILHWLIRTAGHCGALRAIQRRAAARVYQGGPWLQRPCEAFWRTKDQAQAGTAATNGVARNCNPDNCRSTRTASSFAAEIPGSVWLGKPGGLIGHPTSQAAFGFGDFLPVQVSLLFSTVTVRRACRSLQIANPTGPLECRSAESAGWGKGSQQAGSHGW